VADINQAGIRPVTLILYAYYQSIISVPGKSLFRIP